MITSLLAAISMLTLGLRLSARFGKPLELTLAPAVSLAILYLMAFGSLGLMTSSVIAAAILLLGAGIHTVLRHPEHLRQLLNPGPVLFCAALAALALINRNAQLLYWDEFSHWGQVTKFLVATGNFPRVGDILFDAYPFGTSVIQAAFGQTERSWIFAQNFLKCSALVCCFAGLRWRDFPIFLPAFLLLAAAIPFFVELGGWADLLSDAPLGLYAGAVLLIYFRGGSDLQSIVLATIITASLLLLKDIGVLFAIVVSTIILIDKTIAYLLQRERARFGALLVALAPFIATIITHHLWSLSIQSRSVATRVNLSASSIEAGMLRDNFGTKLLTIVSQAGRALYSTPFSSAGYAFPLILSGLTILLAVVLVNRSTKDRVRLLVSYLVLLGGFSAYIVVLLVMYLFAFSDYEGLSLASFPRYVNSYFIFVAIFAIGVATMLPSGTWRGRSAPSAIALLLAACLLAPQYRRVIVNSVHSPESQSRTLREETRERVGDLAAVPPTARVYILWNGTIGEQFFMSMYELTPRKTNRDCFSVGTKRHAGDVWTCDVSAERFLSIFREGYSHLMIGKSDSDFQERFGSLFNETPGVGWYVLDATTEKFVLLRPGHQ